LSNCNFEQATLRYTDMSLTNISDSSFKDADLFRTNLRNAKLTKPKHLDRSLAAPDDADYLKAESWAPAMKQ
jgi:uncharacterized protein YjbI with pentapeptide repeats